MRHQHKNKETIKGMKMFRRDEVENLVSSFVACLQPIIGRYRGIDGVDVVKHFAVRVEAERERYMRKLESLRTNPDFATLGDVIDKVRMEVNGIADGEIARAKANNKVEHDHISAAIKAAANDLNNAVDKLGKN
jgi:hypothetical protein